MKRKNRGRGARPRGDSPTVRAVICLWMLACSVLFFVLAWYQYDYVGQLKAMAESQTWQGDEQIVKVHWFYVKTFYTNVTLGGVAVAAGLLAALGKKVLASTVLWLWLAALAISQGMTLYTMTSDNIIFETYLKGGVFAAVLAMLLMQRRLAAR